MKIQNVIKVSVVGVAMLGLSACSSFNGASKNSPSVFGANDANSARHHQVANARGAGHRNNVNGRNVAHQSVQGDNESTYYFGFDTDSVQPADQAAIRQQAQVLVANPNSRVMLQGNTDERGSREYNIALGERRAERVANLLMQQGVNRRQINVVSFGEEKPAVVGHNEAAYQQNRRVHVTIEQGRG